MPSSLKRTQSLWVERTEMGGGGREAQGTAYVKSVIVFCPDSASGEEIQFRKVLETVPRGRTTRSSKTQEETRRGYTQTSHTAGSTYSEWSDGADPAPMVVFFFRGAQGESRRGGG